MRSRWPKGKKTDKYNELVDVLCRRFPHNDVRFRTMIVGVMGTISTSIKQTLREIQPQAQTSYVIHQIIQTIGNHNHKLWIVRNQLHNRRQNHTNEVAGTWVPKCRWLRWEYFKYCKNVKNGRSNRGNQRRNDLNYRIGRKSTDTIIKC